MVWEYFFTHSLYASNCFSRTLDLLLWMPSHHSQWLRWQVLVEVDQGPQSSICEGMDKSPKCDPISMHSWTVCALRWNRHCQNALMTSRMFVHISYFMSWWRNILPFTILPPTPNPKNGHIVGFPIDFICQPPINQRRINAHGIIWVQQKIFRKLCISSREALLF